MTKPLVYLASPYSHKDPFIRELRFLKVCAAAGRLINRGFTVFAPIAYSHPIATVCQLPLEFEFWKAIDRDYISVSKKLFVLTLDGWEQSKGVSAEIEIAKEFRIPIEYITMEE